MSLIDSSYFIHDINIPTGQFSDLQGFINRYEPEILTDLLGYELAKEVIAYDAETSDQRIIDLVEGKEYTVKANGGRDQLIKWGGLINAEKKSLIAYYVYYWDMRAKATHTATVGEVKRKGENSVNAEQNAKIMNAWTRMLSLFGFCGQANTEPSALNFLDANAADYPEWMFTPRGSVNAFDL